MHTKDQIKEANEKYNRYLEYCRESRLPAFAPKKCFSCGYPVFLNNNDKFPTGCHKCHRSFVS